MICITDGKTWYQCFIFPMRYPKFLFRIVFSIVILKRIEFYVVPITIIRDRIIYVVQSKLKKIQFIPTSCIVKENISCT